MTFELENLLVFGKFSDFLLNNTRDVTMGGKGEQSAGP